MLTGRAYVRPAMLGQRLILVVEEQDANGERTWRDAALEDLAEGVTLSTVAQNAGTLPMVRREARA